jgi:hypothetical protein
VKRASTAVAKQSRNFPEQQLTIGLELGDRSNYYCVLDEAGCWHAAGGSVCLTS